MKKITRIIILLCFFLGFINSLYFSQDFLIRENRLVKKMPKKDLINSVSFRKIEIVRELLSPEDSVNTYYWKNYFWYIGIVKIEGTVVLAELFAYDSTSKSSIQVTNHLFPYPSATLDNLHFFNYKMFISTNCVSCDSSWVTYKLLVIDDQKMRVAKEVNFGQNSWIEREYKENNKLYYILQPAKRKFELGYYLFFWMRDGRPAKWHYENVGSKKLYVFDENFDLVKEEIIQ